MYVLTQQTGLLKGVVKLPYAGHKGVWGSGDIAPIILNLELYGEWSDSRPGEEPPAPVGWEPEPV